MYVLIAVFSSEDEATVAQKRISSFVEWSHLQSEVPDGAVVTIKTGDSVLFEQEVVDEEEGSDDEDM